MNCVKCSHVTSNIVQLARAFISDFVGLSRKTVIKVCCDHDESQYSQ